jgi:tetratricopeptide (TPR) repeat protein
MRRILLIVAAVALGSGTLTPFDSRGLAQGRGQAPDPADLVKQGRALAAQGKHEDAQRLYRQALRANPRSFEVRLAMGICLDLQGQYAEARTHLAEAIKQADGITARNQARNALAVSYAFEGRAADAMKHLAPVFEQQRVDKDAAGSAATANALGRIYLETSDVLNARKWYELGYEQSLQISGLAPSEKDLWELRWLHALARLAAREGKSDEVRRHVAAFEQVMNRRGRLSDDNEIYRYLLGYVAYYAKDYDRAIAELVRGNLSDPFIVNLIAMSYEAKGDTANAQQYYRRTLESNAHSLNNALVRPYARLRIR